MIELAHDDLSRNPRGVIPYTTSTGIQIGCRYEPPREYPQSEDMERLQSAMIDTGGKLRVLDAVLWVASVALIVAVANAPAIWRWFA